MARACTQCGSPIQPGFGFCGHCGNRVVEAAPPPPPPPPPPPRPSGNSSAPVMRVVVLRGPVAEGSSYGLRQGHTSIGCAGDIALPIDSGLDEIHVVLSATQGRVDIVDVPGASGVWRRIREPAQLRSGDTVFAGEQYLIVRLGDDAPRERVDGGHDVPEETFGTPLPAPMLHITQLLGAGIPGRVASTDKAMLTVGRENCDLSFPQDRFMSGRHLRIERDGDSLSLIDVGSLNGTFSPVGAVPVSLQAGDEIMVGSLLFRVDV